MTIPRNIAILSLSALMLSACYVPPGHDPLHCPPGHMKNGKCIVQIEHCPPGHAKKGEC